MGQRVNKKYLVVILVVVVVLVSFAYTFLNSPSSGVVSGDWVGVCVHDLSVEDARMVGGSGVGWVRIDVFPQVGSAFLNAKEQNLKVLGILDSWMFNKTLDFTLKEWRENVTFYVSSYAGLVEAWEIWNEPSHPTYTISAEMYYSMVEIASGIIREVDPGARILLFGGLHLWSGDDSHRELDFEFASQLSATNIHELGDAISLHAYPWMGQVQSWIWDKYDEALDYYQELFPSLELWITETGHPIEHEGEQGQAQYLHDALQYFKGKVARVFWYSLLDNSWEQNSFGLIDSNPRLAYYELQNEFS